MMFDLEPRILAGPAQVIVGLVLTGIAIRLWTVHPVNRVFRLGPYVTEAGMRALLRLRSTFAAIGLAFVSGGAARTHFWFSSRQVSDPVVAFFGSLEAGLAVWAAFLAIHKAVLLWRLG